MTQHTTGRGRLIADRLATKIITGVGLSVILAVVGMMFFLVKTVLPLGQQEQLEQGVDLGPSSTRFAVAEEVGLPVRQRLVTEPSADAQNSNSQNGTAQNINLQESCLVDFDLTSTNTRLLRQRVSLGPDGQTVLLTPVTASAEGNPLRCVGLGGSEFLLVDTRPEKTRVIRVVLDFERSFLSEADVLIVPQEIMRALRANGFAQAGDLLYVRKSATAPIAKLAPRLKVQDRLEFPLLPVWLAPENVDQHEFSFQPLDETHTLFIVRQGKAIVDSLLTSRKANAITGQTITSQIPLQLSVFPAGIVPNNVVSVSLPKDNELWRFLEDGRIIRGTLNETTGAIDVPQSAVAVETLEGFGHLEAAIRVYGGSVYFLDNGKGGCAALDVGRLARIKRLDQSGASAPEVQPDAQRSTVLWRAPCEAPAQFVRYAASPHARLVLRATDTGLEAFETTTGRLAFANSATEIMADVDESAASQAPGNSTEMTPTAPKPGTPWVTSLGFSSTGSQVLMTIFGRLRSHTLFAPHLEASAQSFFTKVHYEGYETPSYSWQSTSGTDDFQAKYSLMPLIWGTFKATLYALLFAVPLGIFSAIYSSEILDRTTRNFIKPSIEMMASLPSVVLGYMAAILIAPWIERNVVSVLLAGLATPFALYLCGNLLSAVSAKHISARGLYASRRLLFLLGTGFVFSLFALMQLGHLIELTAFGGDIKSFLAGGPGSEGVLWGILLLPAVLIALWSAPLARHRKMYRTLAFIFGPALAISLGLLISYTSARENVLGSYSQRNTLVIAVAMGFAIIPIIYSLAEDALTSVPSSLRAASLACGASVWQTTARVVLPTAASGIFSAIMVGLGRGIGETMIAVMATGNSAIISWNPFEGLRSLAANIAVELPEAPQGGTHYRVLFLSALVLFTFTFVLNSAAEVLRAKYRERSKAL